MFKTQGTFDLIKYFIDNNLILKANITASISYASIYEVGTGIVITFSRTYDFQLRSMKKKYNKFFL